MIGTRLCEHLVVAGHNVMGVDKVQNKYNKAINKITYKGNLKNKEFVKTLPKNMDMVIHLAANARVYNLVVKPDLAYENILTTYNVLEYARKNKIKKFMFSSSREVYGNDVGMRHNESEVDIRLCESPYTASKMCGESLVYAYNNCYGINHIVLRFSNVYGMYDGSDRVIPLFLRRAKRNLPLTVFGKGKLLDFTYIDDLMKGMMYAINNFDKAKNDTYNLASGKPNHLVFVANLIKKLLKSKSKIIIKKNRTGEVVKFVADISNAQNKLKYRPEYSIKEGIKKTIENENIIIS